MQVKVTITMRGRPMSIDNVKDARITTPFYNMANEVGATLEKVRCPEHGTAATDVRIHVDARGAADLKYASCCPKLGELIKEALG